MYDLVLKEGMWHEIAFSEGKRRRSFFQVAVSPHPWDSPGKKTGVACHFLLQCIKVKVKLLSRVQPFETHGVQPTRLLHPWDSPGKSTGVGCHPFQSRGLKCCFYSKSPLPPVYQASNFQNFNDISHLLSVLLPPFSLCGFWL